MIKQLLYIDDDPDDYEIFADVMREISPDTLISWLSTCSDLDTILDASTFDIIFMDIHLPKFSGSECLSMIRSHPFYASIPVAFYTGSDQREFDRLNTGENTYYIPKANTFSELKDRLDHFLAEGVSPARTI